MMHAVVVGVDRADAAILRERFADAIPAAYRAAREYKAGMLILPPDSDVLLEAVYVAVEAEMQPRLRRILIATPRELREVGHFHVRLPQPLTYEHHLVDYGTTCLALCPHCDLGRRTVGDVRVNATLLRGAAMVQLDDEICVNAATRDAILAAGLTGARFDRRVLDYRGRPTATDYYILDIDHILSPMPDSVWLEPHANARCPHSTIYLRSDIQYPADVLAAAPDFSRGQEQLDNAACRPLILSAKARAVLRTLGVRVSAEPVTACGAP